MKTIEISDDDYNALMEFSKELQTQSNHSQAFPYFWEPASEKLVTDHNNEGEVKQVFDPEQCEAYTLEEYAEANPDLWDSFTIDEGIPGAVFERDLEPQWHEYLEFNCDEVSTFSSEWKQLSDHNPSLFLSDVQEYIESNRHHLGRNPRTYARTVDRMPKMKRLIEIVYRLNPQPEKTINDEARRYVLRKSTLPHCEEANHG